MHNAIGSMLRERLRLAAPAPLAFERGRIDAFHGFSRERIEYRGLEGDVISVMPLRLHQRRGV
ncbi:hypothetical protein CNR27_13110 [Luteimonas chenhongjianii]|uniref:Uncharacterized protein n=1 Tax=Luteimonas chenhongjianii TaxID=2006110 RepID=A0A290XGG7_9GAMM|nr:hypothetical protein CNR27_13110 [Luteimonas chenhongjianii]RPD88071.1 hypothetical protein EGK76_02500 [Luteimonas sp. 100069]